LQKPIDDNNMKDYQFYKCITTELVRLDELHPIPESFVTFDRQVQNELQLISIKKIVNAKMSKWD
jgi:hypothetical protein